MILPCSLASHSFGSLACGSGTDEDEEDEVVLSREKEEVRDTGMYRPCSSTSRLFDEEEVVEVKGAEVGADDEGTDEYSDDEEDEEEEASGIASAFSSGEKLGCVAVCCSSGGVRLRPRDRDRPLLNTVFDREDELMEMGVSEPFLGEEVNERRRNKNCSNLSLKVCLWIRNQLDVAYRRCTLPG